MLSFLPFSSLTSRPARYLSSLLRLCSSWPSVICGRYPRRCGVDGSMGLSDSHTCVSPPACAPNLVAHTQAKLCSTTLPLCIHRHDVPFRFPMLHQPLSGDPPLLALFEACCPRHAVYSKEGNLLSLFIFFLSSSAFPFQINAFVFPLQNAFQIIPYLLATHIDFFVSPQSPSIALSNISQQKGRPTYF